MKTKTIIAVYFIVIYACSVATSVLFYTAPLASLNMYIAHYVGIVSMCVQFAVLTGSLSSFVISSYPPHLKYSIWVSHAITILSPVAALMYRASLS